MNPTPTTDTQRLRELLAAATPGPWHGIHGDSYCAYPSVGAGNGHHFILYDASDADGRRAEDDTKFPGLNADADLIAALRNEAPALLDELERLRLEVAAVNKYAPELLNRVTFVSDLTAERDKLREEVERLREQVKKPRSCDTDEIIRLSNEVTHWRANAKNQAEIRRAIATRPDLKERAPYVEKIAAERDSLRRENAELRKDSDRFTKFLEWVDDAVEWTGIYEHGKREVERIRVMRRPMK